MLPSFAFALLLSAVLLLLAYRRSTNVSDALSILIFVLGPAIVFACRGDMAATSLGRSPLGGLSRWGAGILVGAVGAWISYRQLRSPRPLTSRAFLLVVVGAYVPIVLGFALRTVSFDPKMGASFFKLDLKVLGPILVTAALSVLLSAWLLRERDSPLRVMMAVLPLLVSAPLSRTVFIAWRPMPRPLPSAKGVADRRPAVPGVVLITLDTTRLDFVWPYRDRDASPRLARLAEASLVFDNAHAAAPFTLSSHASLFTGLLPSEHGARPLLSSTDNFPENDVPLPSNIPTLAERMAGMGYQTAGICANYGYLGEWTGLSRGFQEYSAAPEKELHYYPLLVPIEARLTGGLPRNAYLEAWSGDAISDGAIGWLTTHRNRPYFLFLNYMDAHEYAAGLPPSRLPRPVGHENDERRAMLSARYSAGVAQEDRGLGRLFDWMSAQGIFDESLIVVTADHGEYLGEHGFWRHSHDLHEPVLRVPRFVKLPRSRGSLHVSTLITQPDVHNLLLQAAAGASAEQIVASLHSGREPRVVAENWTGESLRRRWPTKLGWLASRAVYAGPWKLIERIGAAGELYDLEHDPQELNDLYHSQPEAAARMATDMTARLPPLSLTQSSAPNAPMDPADVERLRSLGYVGE
jgi:arylsulfatase A-like enzyme